MEEIVKNKAKITSVNIDVELLKKIRNLLEVANSRMNWKIEELLPVGLVITDIDKILTSTD